MKCYSGYLLAIIIIFFSSLSSEARYPLRECIRFSPRKMSKEFIFYGPSTLESKKWINVDIAMGVHTFSVNLVELSRNSTETFFNGIYPACGVGGSPDDWPEQDGYIVCQWDECNEENLQINLPKNGILLRTPYNCAIDSDDDHFDDIDIYCFTPQSKAYCIEVEANSNVKISVSSSKYNLIPLELKKCYSGYGEETQIIKRGYKIDFNPSTKYYVIVYGDTSDNNYYDTDHNYKLTIKKARPMILVHGIGAEPRGAILSKKSFGEIPEKLPYLLEMQPTCVFEFPWDSSNGLYTEYCGDTQNKLYGFVDEKSDDWPLKPTIMAHSMGGTLTVRQIEMKDRLLNDAHSFIFFGVPFCGSPKASWPGSGYFTDTSEENIEALKRGNFAIWELLKLIPNSLFSKSSFIVGENDGCVYIPSANLPKTMRNNTPPLFVKLSHTEMKWLNFPCKGEKKKVFDLIKDKIKDEGND